jgi:hypothetical protein
MEFFGNIFTHYNYTTTDISTAEENGIQKITSAKSNFNLQYNNADKEVNLPTGSPFKDWAAARRFAGPLPFTFTYNSKESSVLIIEGVRENWVPKPLQVINYHFGFLDQECFRDAVLANAFIIEDIPYHWKKGKIEKWK